MNDKNPLKKEIEKYLKVPFYMAVLLVVMNGVVYGVDTTSGVVVTVFILAYFGVVMYLYFRKRPNIMSDLVAFSFAHGSVQSKLIKELAIPYTLVDSNGRVLWSNKAFYDIVKSDKQHMRKHIQHIFTDITLELLQMEPEDQNQRVVHIFQNDKNYRVEIRRVDVQSVLSTNLAEDAHEDDILFAIYLYDETQLVEALDEKEKIKLVAGHIYIDNYEEAMESTEEVRRALLVALIDRKITKYMQTAKAIITKLEKDKYLFVCQQQHLEQLQQGKFSLLDEVRSINIGNETPVTLSIAVGIDPDDDNYTTAYEYSHMAMDMALGRGGDQAVIKKGDKIIYYGGKTQSAEKNTRVKARVKAHALKEMLITKDRVIIMGHKKPDIDCLGSALGIYRLACMMDKKAHIVINEVTSSIRPAMNNFIGSNVYPEDMFFNSEQALEAVDGNTVVIVVDVNRPHLTECEELLAHTRNIVVIDHHRQSGEVIDHATLSYIEPYASSACEMVAEILQYSMDKPKLRPAEADAMYAGILVDTDNFVTKTGVRTFEAASFLRKSGADMTRVRKAYRTDIDSYKQLAKGVEDAELFLDNFAISDVPTEGVDSPTVLAAKVANDLLDIDNVRASFVLSKIDNVVYISARSIDDVNVQVIMEQFGGGGHGTVAGAQIENASIEDVKQQIRDLVRKMRDDGDF
ncbi:MAG: DHH family phosphoesterase [Lachnospiraceae bacterium]|nr:DHH family phosphoesterase [Lachnospiraceae bacterium]HCJ07103.1 DHH family phosphoesterase [Lachnospiraceae bacterium]